jgi:hypothetical protein
MRNKDLSKAPASARNLNGTNITVPIKPGRVQGFDMFCIEVDEES